MKLSEIIEIIKPRRLPPGVRGDIDVTGVCSRSDRVRPGCIFVALKGERADGHDYAADALSRGAAAVVVERPVGHDAAEIEVASTRRALGRIAAHFHGRPSERMAVIGITGTNGKTTTAWLLEHILKTAGHKTGVIGTINYHCGRSVFRSGLTTPEADDLQKVLSEMADAGTTHVVMEVSSHGVALDRICGCRFSAGVFTNLSQDHLDFHGDMETYWSIKKQFFTNYIGEDAAVVVNCENEYGRELSESSPGEKWTTGTDPSHTVRAEDVLLDESGVTATMVLPGSRFDFHSPLVGKFNLENILCAAGAAASLGIDAEIIREGIETFSTVPGRLEPVPNASGRHVFVDFSHTPDALENVLSTLRTVIGGRLICIFGCGGDRDRSKRPLMGEIAGKIADLVIVTSDNPRTEDPQSIIEEILTGVRWVCTREERPDRIDAAFVTGTCVVEPDRSEAIRLGIRVSSAGDAILIAGKGHETYQIVGGEKLDFDDRLEARKALTEYGLLDDRFGMDN